jgi:hypothetical protein
MSKYSTITETTVIIEKSEKVEAVPVTGLGDP